MSPPRRRRTRRASPLSDAGHLPHGPRGGRQLVYLGLARQRARIRDYGPHLWFSRLFYEADRGPRLATVPTKTTTSKPVVPVRPLKVTQSGLPQLMAMDAEQSAPRPFPYGPVYAPEPQPQPQPPARRERSFWRRAGSALAALGVLLAKVGAKLKAILILLPKV